MKKCRFISMLAAAAIAASQTGVMAAADNVTVRLNGRLLDFDVPPQIINDRTMVPFRAVFEAMGATVEWDQAAQKVTAIKDEVTLELMIGCQFMYMNGRVVELDSPPLIVNERTLIPVRAVAESFGAAVDWNGDMRAVTISFDENGRVFDPKYTVTVNSDKYRIGMSAAELGTPEDLVPSTEGFMWYVYGIDTYEDLIAVGVYDGRVVKLISSGKDFEYYGYKAGDVADIRWSNCLFCDSNDNMKIHSVYLFDHTYKENKDYSPEALAGESKMNFHFTNGFRVSHGLDPLIWSDAAAAAARLHSEDMAVNAYLSHKGLDGTRLSERIERQGITWSRCGENISAGHTSGFSAFDGWINSEGHRKNMLGDFKYLGVGAGAEHNSFYFCYFTQDFYR